MKNNIKIYQVSVRNRVLHKVIAPFRMMRKLRGQQGKWYDEILIVIASDEIEASELVKTGITKRKVLGIPVRKQDNFEREVKIKKIEEVA